MRRNDTQTIYRFATRRFTLTVFASPDNDLDLSWDDDGSIREGLENGEFIAFEACVVLKLDGREVASDFLCGCIYRSPEDFRAESGYFQHMIRTVCREARKALANVPRLRAA